MTRRKKEPAAEREPTEREAARIEQASQSQRSRPARVALKWSPDGLIGGPHRDHGGTIAAVMEALGTTSGDFRDSQLGFLDFAGRDRGHKRAESAVGLNAALAIVQAIEPQNELEAAMAVQMAGVHSLSCELLGRAKQTDRTDQIALYGGMAVKLARTFAAQVEALAKLRGGGKQQVEVRHVYVNGNAVIGDVHQGGGATAETGHQPHAPGLAFAPGETVRSPIEAEREALHGAGSEGEGSVPNARGL